MSLWLHMIIKNHKFKIESLKGLSCLEYDLTGHVFTVLHTIVPAALSGKFSRPARRSAYNWAVKNRYTVRSDCTYMTAWMKRHER